MNTGFYQKKKQYLSLSLFNIINIYAIFCPTRPSFRRRPLPCHKCKGRKNPHYLWEYLSSSLEIYFLAAAAETSSVKLCASLARPQLPCQLSSASVSVCPNCTICIKSWGGGACVCVCVCNLRRNIRMQIVNLSSLATVSLEPCKLHSASFQCIDTVKPFKPGSFIFIQRDPAFLFGVMLFCLCVCVGQRWNVFLT